uniref:Uncharacterized protein n=1 Tax=Arundo donax TaxID=35708 RepID=A0A0A8Z666_ARUDO
MSISFLRQVPQRVNEITFLLVPFGILPPICSLQAAKWSNC